MRFRVLGPVEIESDDGQVHTPGRRQERCVLAVLLLEAGRVVAVDRLCQLLWDDNPPQHPHRVLHTQIARIRAMLAHAGAAEHAVTLTSHQRGYLLTVDLDTVDVHRFRRLLDAAEHTNDLDHRDRLLREALALWRGPALHNAASDRLRERLCADLDELRLRALEESIATGLDRGRGSQLLPELARLGAEYPTRERLVELHLRALHQQARTAEALEVYRRARTRLVQELGLEPGRRLRELHQAILRGEPIPAAVASAGAGITGAATPTVPAQLPADVADFTGRDAALGVLDKLLATSHAPPSVVICAIAGSAGVGKTALAVHWAHRAREHFPDGQLHIDLRGYAAEAPLAPLHALARFLRALGVPAEQVPVDVDEAATMYRTVLADKHLLVVLDNAHSVSQVRPLLPGSLTCRVLITSRDRLDGLAAREGARRLAVDVLSPTESIGLLAAILGHERVYAEPDASHHLARLCAHLPLALRICAALLAARPARRIAELVADVDTADRLDHLAVPGDPDGAVRAAFDLSYHTLRPATGQLFRRLGLLPYPEFSAATAAALTDTDVDQAQTLLEELATAHLVNEVTPGRYGFHDLLQSYAAERASTQESPPEQAAATHRLLQFHLRSLAAAARLVYPEKLRLTIHVDAATTPPFGNRDTAMRWLNAERTFLVAVVGHLADHGPHPAACQLAHALAGYLAMTGYTVEGLAVAQAGIDAANRYGDPQATAGALLDLASARFIAEQYNQAFEDYSTALALCQQLGWREGQADALDRLALYHWETDQIEQAADYHRQAVQLNQAAGRPTGEATSLVNLGSLHLHQGHYQAAAECFGRAATLFRDADALWGEGMARTALGQLHLEQGQHEQAHDQFIAARDIQRRTGDQRNEAEVLSGLATTQLELGRLDQAIETARAAVSLTTSTGTRRTEADARNTLGRIHTARADHQAATAEHHTALDIATAIVHRRAKAQAHLGLATALTAQASYDQAHDHATIALTIARNARYSPLEIQALATLADIDAARPAPDPSLHASGS